MKHLPLKELEWASWEYQLGIGGVAKTGSLQVNVLQRSWQCCCYSCCYMYTVIWTSVATCTCTYVPYSVVAMQRNFISVSVTNWKICVNNSKSLKGKLKPILTNFFSAAQRKFASENGYFEDSTKPDFWDKFVDFANTWNKIGIPNKWATLRLEDESKYNETLETSH